MHVLIQLDLCVGLFLTLTLETWMDSPWREHTLSLTQSQNVADQNMRYVLTSVSWSQFLSWLDIWS